MSNRKKNPRPKAHDAVREYMKAGLKEEFARIRKRLDALEKECDEYVWAAVGGAIDGAIEDAYNEGVEDGEPHRYS